MVGIVDGIVALGSIKHFWIKIRIGTSFVEVVLAGAEIGDGCGNTAHSGSFTFCDGIFCQR